MSRSYVLCSLQTLELLPFKQVLTVFAEYGRKLPLPATSQLAICKNARTPRWLFFYLVNILCIIVENLFSQKWNKLPTCTDLSNNSVNVGCDWASEKCSRLRKMGEKFIRFSNSCLCKHMLSVCLLYPRWWAFLPGKMCISNDRITVSLVK